MINRLELESYLNEYLVVDKIRDYCPNGLQVEGKEEIKHIVTGVTASKALIDYAVENNADAILVHHGFFWKGESQPVRGMKRRRLMALLSNEINLFGFHLPLDVHHEVGNNVQLARILGIDSIQGHKVDNVSDLLWSGELANETTVAHLANHIHAKLEREPTVLGPEKIIRRIAWCTGGAQRYLDNAVDLGVDAYLTGEVSEQTTHTANESEITFFACGHHATERYGIQALGEHLADKFALNVEFVDIDNPI